jgi:undecaprenyl-diphosphatase
MNEANTALIAVGFATSFVAGWFVVRSLLDYVSQHGFALFAWWRILVGALGLIALALMG